MSENSISLTAALFNSIEIHPIDWSQTRRILNDLDSPGQLFRNIHRSHYRSQYFHHSDHYRGRTDYATNINTRQHFLHVLAAKHDIPENILYIIIQKSGGDSSCLKSLDPYGWSVFHRASEAGNLSLMRMILSIYPKSASKWTNSSSYLSYLPLHTYLRNKDVAYPSVEVVNLLLECYPNAVCVDATATSVRFAGLDVLELICSKLSNIREYGLILECCKCIVSVCRTQCVLAAVAYPNSTSPAFLPLHYIMSNSGGCLNILLSYGCSDDENFSIALSILSYLEDEMHTRDSGGNLPLHLLCRNYSQTTIPRNHRSRHSSRFHSCLKRILQLNSQAARVRNNEGRYPLHLAIERGMSWEVGVKLLWQKAPGCLHVWDCKLKIAPFMAAAVCKDLSIDGIESDFSSNLITCTNSTVVAAVSTSFSLLKKHPDVLKHCHSSKYRAYAKTICSLSNGVISIDTKNTKSGDVAKRGRAARQQRASRKVRRRKIRNHSPGIECTLLKCKDLNEGQVLKAMDQNIGRNVKHGAPIRGPVPESILENLGLPRTGANDKSCLVKGSVQISKKRQTRNKENDPASKTWYKYR